eukprot:3735217-Alexandrium_andersonii.AAC.1
MRPAKRGLWNRFCGTGPLRNGAFAERDLCGTRPAEQGPRNGACGTGPAEWGARNAALRNRACGT